MTRSNACPDPTTSTTSTRQFVPASSRSASRWRVPTSATHRRQRTPCAGHEQRFVFPELGSFAPTLSAELEAEHLELEELQSELRTLAHRAHGPSSKDREEAGRLLARSLALLVAGQLRHLDREETEANAAAWANRTDVELAAIQGRMQAAMSPESRDRLARRMLPALNVGEQVELLAGARRNLSASAFGALLALAREILGAERWAVLGSRAGIDAPAARP